MTGHTRISQRRLEGLTQIISDRDRAILESVHKCRYLTTLQITRLHFTNSVSRRAAVRAANRGLTKLKEYGLIRPLQRRIGGVRAGSGSFVWKLTPAGYKLIYLARAEKMPHKNFYEPTPYFLEHTLVVAEAYLQLTEICKRRNMTLKRVLFEPDCWRCYGADGKKYVLKPDMFAATQSGNYEDCWFIEIDRATETLPCVIEKCQRYMHYFAKQDKKEVFPYVVWIVPDKRRKSSLKALIYEEYPRGPDIFVTITPEELEPLIVNGAEKYIKNQRCRHVEK